MRPTLELAAALAVLAAISSPDYSQMFIWDLVSTRFLHKAYWIWLAFMVPSSILIHVLWDTDWWHATAPRLLGL